MLFFLAEMLCKWHDIHNNQWFCLHRIWHDKSLIVNGNKVLFTQNTFLHLNSVNFGRHFWFSLSLYLETKMLNSLSHILVIWVFHSFSLVLVDKKSLHFCQLLVITFSETAVTKIYFGSYFICSLQTKIVINSSLFRPNQLSLWEISIKDWIWKNWNKFSFLW